MNGIGDWWGGRDLDENDTSVKQRCTGYSVFMNCGNSLSGHPTWFGQTGK
jgi:hypothetical protein